MSGNDFVCTDPPPNRSRGTSGTGPATAGSVRPSSSWPTSSGAAVDAVGNSPGGTATPGDSATGGGRSRARHRSPADREDCVPALHEWVGPLGVALVLGDRDGHPFGTDGARGRLEARECAFEDQREPRRPRVRFGRARSPVTVGTSGDGGSERVTDEWFAGQNRGRGRSTASEGTATSPDGR